MSLRILTRRFLTGRILAGSLLGLCLAVSASAQTTSGGGGAQPSIMSIPLSSAERSGQAPTLNHIAPRGNQVHIFPNVAGQQARIRFGLAGFAGAGSGLSYHKGPVMNPKTTAAAQTNLEIYTIYWSPATLQNGAATGMATNYQMVNNAMAQLLMGNHLFNVSSQYYQGSSATPIVNQGGLAGSYVDTNAYPASGCTDSATPGACLTDAQIQAEIATVIAAAGWTPGPNKIFLMFTSSGEGSCINSSVCAYTYYCAYHSSFNATVHGVTGPVIYGNEPYGNPSSCQASGQPTPNAGSYGPYADLAANVATHEILEMATDPFGNAWYDVRGNEIGDKCAWNFGTTVYSAPAANQFYASNATYNSPVNNYANYYFELQQEYSDAANAAGQSGCVQYYKTF